MLVAVGDHVAPTDPVVLLESMKMEIPYLAEVDGVVTELLVAPGDVVQEGTGSRSSSRAPPDTIARAGSPVRPPVPPARFDRLQSRSKEIAR